jgi:hypothetical protein
MAFWNLDHIDTHDPLNETIWAESPAVQAAIQPYRDDWQDGEIGAQQAMRAPLRLRWVPDLVGKHWRSENALVVIGSAYGPFIKNSHGQHEMLPSDYDQPTADTFQRRFVETVVASRGYYTQVARLSEHAVSDASHLILFDLCRVAFVRCGSPRDAGGDSVVRCKSAHHLFSRYVESPVPRGWLWSRLVDSEASAVIALGTVAEHGLLRLFVAKLGEPRIVDSLDPSIKFVASDGDSWPRNYAHSRRFIRVRSEQKSVPCWVVSGITAAGALRKWRVAVVPHPTGARNKLDDYSRRAVQSAYANRSSA